MDLKEQIKQQLEENQKSKGFGDTFEQMNDCGCDRCKDLWNKWLPYKKQGGCKKPCD